MGLSEKTKITDAISRAEKAVNGFLGIAEYMLERGTMKMFRWKPGMVRFMRDASEYGSYHQKLCVLVLDGLTNLLHICVASLYAALVHVAYIEHGF